MLVNKVKNVYVLNERMIVMNVRMPCATQQRKNEEERISNANNCNKKYMDSCSENNKSANKIQKTTAQLCAEW